MERYSYHLRRWYPRWEDALDEMSAWSAPGYSLLPVLSDPVSTAQKDGDGGWVYVLIEMAGSPPGPVLPGWERVD